MKLGTAPGAGTSRTFTVRKNGVDTALTLTISNTATTGADTTHSFTVAAGDRVSISSTVSGIPVGSVGKYCMNYTGDTTAESVILGGSRNLSLSTSVTEYKTVDGIIIATGISTTENDHRAVVPTGGTVKKLYIDLVTAPSAGTSRTFTLYKNGLATALTLTISGTATTGNDTTHTVTVVAGDELSLESTISGTPVASKVRHGMVFLADTDGEAILLGCHGTGNPGNSNDKYGDARGGNGPGASETISEQLVSKCTFKKLYVELSTAYSGNTTFSVRVNDASPLNDLSIALAGNATTGNDTTHTVSCNDGDTINMLWTFPGFDTDIKRTGWGMVIVAVVPVTTVLASSETVGIIEATTRAWTAPRGLSDSSTVIERFAQVLASVRGSQDTVSLQSEGVTRSWALSRDLPIDRLTITEILISFRNKIINIFESLGIVESFKRTYSTVRSVSETAGIVEAFTKLNNSIRNLSDSMSVVETIDSLKVRILHLAESLGIVESLSRALSLVRSFTDVPTITETSTRAWKIVRRLSTETVTITEILSQGRLTVRLLMEKVGITEMFSKGTIFVKNVSEALGITDTFTKLKLRLLDLSDFLNITENVVNTSRVVIFFNRVLSEKISIMEFFATPLNWIKRTKPISTWIKRSRP